MISNPLDYAECPKCMIHQAEPISATSHEELVTPRIFTGSKRPYTSHRLYALGWETFDYHGETTVGHSGGTNVFTSNMIYLPPLKWGFVAFDEEPTSREELFPNLPDVPLSLSLPCKHMLGGIIISGMGPWGSNLRTGSCRPMQQIELGDLPCRLTMHLENSSSLRDTTSIPLLWI